jgi:hypothetical protein
VFWYKWHETLFGDGVKDREKENMLDRIIMPHAFIFLIEISVWCHSRAVS